MPRPPEQPFHRDLPTRRRAVSWSREYHTPIGSEPVLVKFSSSRDTWKTRGSDHAIPQYKEVEMERSRKRLPRATQPATPRKSTEEPRAAMKTTRSLKWQRLAVPDQKTENMVSVAMDHPTLFVVGRYVFQLVALVNRFTVRSNGARFISLSKSITFADSSRVGSSGVHPRIRSHLSVHSKLCKCRFFCLSHTSRIFLLARAAHLHFLTSIVTTRRGRVVILLCCSPRVK